MHFAAHQAQSTLLGRRHGCRGCVARPELFICLEACSLSESQPSPKWNTFKLWTFDSVHGSSVAMRPGAIKGALTDPRQAWGRLSIETKALWAEGF